MKRWLWLVAVLLMVGIVFSAAPLMAQEQQGIKWEDRPEHGLAASLKYPGITINPGEKLRVDLIIKNTGRSDEMVMAKVLKAPEGWQADIKYLGNAVTGVYLGAADFVSLELMAQPKDNQKAQPGDYNFVVAVQTKDGKFAQTSGIEVKVLPEDKVDQELEVTTSYPVLQGPTGTSFEFSLEIRNNNSKDQLFNLLAQAPQNWTVSFKPSYENKQISSLKVKGDGSSSLGVVVTPAPNAEAGDYPIKVQVKGDKAKGETDYLVQLTGTHKIKAVTPDGLLSFSSHPGEPSTVSFYVRNDGSAMQSQVEFMTFQPENWKVEFEPKTLENLKPGEFKQVQATITPASQALVGDYSVAIQAKAPQADSTMEFRVTVKASSTWGWIGIGIIVLALLGLGFAFWRFGRR